MLKTPPLNIHMKNKHPLLLRGKKRKTQDSKFGPSKNLLRTKLPLHGEF